MAPRLAAVSEAAGRPAPAHAADAQRLEHRHGAPRGAREALRAAVVRLDAAERGGCPHALRLAHISVAACYREIGALAAAEESLRQALRAARAAGSSRALVETLCELAETACVITTTTAVADEARSRAARDRARDEAFEASALALKAMDAEWAVHALLRIADVLDRCGDHEDSTLLQVRALEALGRA